MIRWLNRTGLAALLAAAAVVAPCTAWYFTGSRAADEEAARLERQPLLQAMQEAARDAEQLGRRLEALRSSESRRPIQDYWTDDDERLGDCVYPSELDSPLAEGPADPLIWAHFQIDEVGELTLPTLPGNERASTREAADPYAIQTAILEELKCADAGHLAALRRPGSSPGRRITSEGGVVTVGAFSWHTLSIDDRPALVAMREVSTPAAVLTQGFVVRASKLREILTSSPQTVEIRPGLPKLEGEAVVPIDGDRWTVSVDAFREIQAARIESRAIRRRFRRDFLLGALAASLAAGAVVLLVRQSERMARQRSRFAAAAAHELRTPLAGLQLYGEMLADDLGDRSRTEIYARRVADEAQRLGHVVSNVLGFSKLERGGLSVRAEPGDVTAAVRDSVDRLRPTLEARGAHLELAVGDEIPRVRFDRDALHQILQNLLDNAEKYSREAADRTIRVRVARDPAGAVVSVEDRGPGVPANQRRSLFGSVDGFPEGNGSAGLGIGLALVSALARSQQAAVAYRDRDGGGSEFSVRFRETSPADLVSETPAG